MLRRAITRRTFTRRSNTQELDRAAQALLEVDGRPVAEHALGCAEVRPRVPDVSGSRWAVLLSHRLAEDVADHLGDTIDARRSPGADVEDLPACAVRLACRDSRVDDVPHLG